MVFGAPTCRRHSGRQVHKTAALFTEMFCANQNTFSNKFCGALNSTFLSHFKEFSMPKYTRNTGKPWKASEVQKLQQLANENTPTRVIGLKLGRTPDAVRTQASKNNISLAPPNQSPYNRRKKT